jgi:hypothetical protein
MTTIAPHPTSATWTCQRAIALKVVVHTWLITRLLTAAATSTALRLKLLPERRTRTKPRIVKRSNSKYQARGQNIDRTSYKATISIDILSAIP